MNTRYFFFWFAVCGVAALLLLFSADTTPILKSYSGLEAQAQVWRQQSPIRVFLALQLLVASLLSWFTGYFGIWLRFRPARWFWATGVLGLLCYYRLDPRYHPDELNALLRGVLLLLFGAAVEISFFRSKGESEAMSLHRSTLVIAASIPLGILAARILTHVPIEEALSVSFGASAVLSYLFLAGLLSASVLFGDARSIFPSREVLVANPDLRWRTLRHLGLNGFLCTLVCAGILLAGGVANLYWVMLAPLVPPIMTIYAPLTWFSAEGATEIFSSVIEESPAGNGVRARLFLGIAFQYLTLLTIAMVTAAVIKGTLFRRVLAHAVLLLYFLPSFWLARMLAGGLVSH